MRVIGLTVQKDKQVYGSVNPNPATTAQPPNPELNQLLTKHLQSESSQGFPQSRLRHLHCVGTGVAKRHVHKGEGSISLDLQHHPSALCDVWRGGRAKSPCDDRQFSHKPGNRWVSCANEGHSQSHITASESIHFCGTSRRNHQLTERTCVLESSH